MPESIIRNRHGVPVFQFVALSGTGKTTFLEKLVAELKSRGLRVGVYKHDGHEFEIDRPGKDSWRFTRAGADVTLLSSAGKAVIMENRPVPPEELADRID
ncbi:MAG: molybdopterin-guanine dinucleotide biosynthesis protein B, partial [Oscillospiraceae bacterium]|nr:molybdopterin-guanine dinucleotide biosynthesis protein B [Oscillospiraceae bacterium]